MPTKKISIYDSNNNYINDIAGPFNEDSALNLTCESEGGSLRQQLKSLTICVCRFNNESHLSLGNPLPTVKWYRGDALLTTASPSKTSAVSTKSVVRNVASFPRLLREHLMMPLTCEASNTNNLTVPVTKTVLIDLNRKWTFYTKQKQALLIIPCAVKPTEVRIIEPLMNMTVGQRVELVCQASGSRPPAKINWFMSDLVSKGQFIVCR